MEKKLSYIWKKRGTLKLRLSLSCESNIFLPPENIAHEKMRSGGGCARRQLLKTTVPTAKETLTGRGLHWGFDFHVIK